MAKVTTKKYLNQAGLAYFYQRLKEVFVRKEDGKALSSNDFTDELKRKLEQIDPSSFLTSVTNHDDSVEVLNNSEIAVKRSAIEDNALQLIEEEGKEGLYVSPRQQLHKLTFGLGEEYTYDGSADVTVPVYTGAIDNHS